MHANHSQRFLLLPFWVKLGCEPNWLAALFEAGVDLTLAGVDLWAPVKVWVGWCLLAHLLGSDPIPSMQQATDQHAALHTMCQILSSASYSDFRARIHELFEAGEVHGALALWASCVEIQHFPPMPDRNLEYPDLPPIRVRPCTQLPCARCEGRRGGYQFPFGGVHCGQQCWSHRVLTLRKPRLVTMMIVHALQGSSLSADKHIPWWVWRACGSAPSRRVTSSCRHIAALVACFLYSVAEVVVRVCFECTQMCLVCQDEAGRYNF